MTSISNIFYPAVRWIPPGKGTGRTLARRTKQGLDYFSFDIDFFQDPKVKFVRIRFNEKGELIIIKLLCDIYRNGYYTDWDEDKAIIFADSVGKNTSHSLANDVVGELVKRGFFDKSIFDSFSILTSSGIQKRFLSATSERKEVAIIEDYWLLDIPESNGKTSYIINRSINGINPPNNPINPPINPQSKVKESKAKQSKVKQTNARDVRISRIDEFLKEYPKKVHENLARNAYISLVGSTEGLEEETIIQATRNYAESCRILKKTDQYILNPENWINNGVWMDYTPEKYVKPVPNQPSTKNQFNNFPQREYTQGDMSNLEKMLLNRNSAGN